ncbi:hypothetical protein D3C86_1536840 [compost metagenome]
MLGRAQAEGAVAFAAEQGVSAEIIEGTADIGIRHFQPVGAFAQVHGVVVVDQSGFQA